MKGVKPLISYTTFQGYEHANFYHKGFSSVDLTDPERLAKCVTQYIYSPCVWSEGIRRKSNFKYARWAMLDFDDGELSLSEALDIWQDVIHVIATTKSHQMPKGDQGPVDRFRVCLLFNQVIDCAKTYEYNVKKLVDKYGADKACVDAARFFFPSKEVVSVYKPDAYIEVQPKPAGWGEFDDRKLVAYGNSLVIPPQARQILNSKLTKPGNRNSQIFKCACILLRAGFSRECVLDLIQRSKCTSLEPQEIDDIVMNKSYRTVMKG